MTRGESKPSGRPGPLAALLGRGSIYTFAFLLQLSASFVTLPVITRLLRANSYGIVALALSISTFVAGIAALGMPQAVTRTYFEPGGPKDSRRLVTACGPLALGITGVSEGILFVLASFGLVTHVGAIAIGLIAIFPGAIWGACLSVLRAADKARHYVIIALLAGPGGQFLGIAILLSAGGGAEGFLLGLVIGNLAAAILGLTVIRAWRSGFPTKTVLRGALSIGIPFVPHSVAWSILALGDRVVVQPFLGFAAVGRYHVAYTLGSVGLSLITSVSNAWMPIVFGARDDERWPVFNETLAAVLVVAAAAAAVISLVGPIALNVVTPSAYHAADLNVVIALVGISALPWAIYSGSTQVLLWRRDTKQLAWITPVAAGANVILVLLLVDTFGLPGVAAATLGAYTLLAVLASRRARRIQQISLFTHVSAGACLAAVTLSITAAAAPDVGLWILARIGCGVSVCCIAGLVLMRQHRQSLGNLTAPLTRASVGSGP